MSQDIDLDSWADSLHA
jgi:hypothetical protein